MLATMENCLRYGPIFLCALSGALPAHALFAQGVRPRLEVRTDWIAGAATSLQFGIGAVAPLGIYTRAGVVASSTVGWRALGNSAARLDAVLRFHLDPFREERWGLYGIAGAGGVRGGDGWSAVIVVGAGLELPGRGRRVWAVEGGLGGGWRLGLAWRSAERFGR
jgi:hypothetical protein